MVMETLAWAAPVANSIRPARATRKERILLWPPGLDCSAALRPPHSTPGRRLWFQRPVRPIVNARRGANKAEEGFYRACRVSRAASGPVTSPNSPRLRNFLAASVVQIRGSLGAIAAEQKEFQMRTTVRTSRLPAGLPVELHLAAGAIVLALLAIPDIGHAQGIVRGAQEGAYEGSRVAGPVGGVVGGAVGAGVGGAVGAVNGVLGIPYRGYRCRGYYNRYGRFRCYR